jgi:hypothetical protein
MKPRLRPPLSSLVDGFLLRPIRPADAESDFEAIMESQAFLRRWEQTGWPSDDFTAEANRDDLVRLARRHDDGEAFTYTVADTADDANLGCVYVFPTSSLLFTKSRIVGTGKAEWSDFEIALYFWVRTSRLPEHADRKLLRALDRWLEEEWSVINHLVVTSEYAEPQITTIENSGREPLFELHFPNKPGRELAYGARRVRPSPHH